MLAAVLVLGAIVAVYGIFGSAPVATAKTAVSVLSFEVGNEGLAWRNGSSMAGWMRWEDVRVVRAFKVDCYTFDTICFAVESAAEGTGFVVDEEHWQFRELLGAFEARLPRFDRDWFPKVAVAAFATCETVLYRAH